MEFNNEKDVNELTDLIFESSSIAGMWKSDAKAIAEVLCAKGYHRQLTCVWLTDRFSMERSICSNCRAVFEGGDNWNYCPKCGAKIEGGINEKNS